MNKLRVLFVVIALCCSSAICAQTTYYYKLTKKIKDGEEYTNTAGGQFVSFVNNICYDSDKYGISVGNGQLTFHEEYSNNSKTYIGNSYFGNVVYRFKTDMSVLNIIVNKNLIYVYKKTTPANNIRTCSLIRKKETNSGGGGSNPYYDNPGYYDPGMNPGSGGGNQDNSYWENYYRDAYKRWENRVSECINDLNWARTNDMKQMLIGTYIQNVHDAQREMRNIRSEAASKGINIPMSSLENISVY